MFPCDHWFEAGRNCIVFPARYLDAPVVRTPAELADFLASAPESLMRRYIEAPSVASAVRRLMRRHEDVATLTLEETAGTLAMSTQTLRRRLREEGNGFQELKDSVRKESANAQLAGSARSINEIALALGFSEPSAFHRAFKKWTGLTPGAWRESAAAR
jgi:AraC-like DNA-binding protein